jgi:hypothetical protein
MTTTRTTKKDLEVRIENLRKMTGRKFFLTGAYGGWQLAEDVGSGSHGITPGFVSKRELEDRLNSILTGLLMGERMEKERKRREDEHPYAYN